MPEGFKELDMAVIGPEILAIKEVMDGFVA